MKCPKCGQSMCYLCRYFGGVKRIKDKDVHLFRIVVVDNYNHFYGQGGHAEKGKCPLWSDNANLHRFEKSLVWISIIYLLLWI